MLPGVQGYASDKILYLYSRFESSFLFSLTSAMKFVKRVIPPDMIFTVDNSAADIDDAGGDSLDNHYNYLAGSILRNRDVFIVSKGEALLSLLSQSVPRNDLQYLMVNGFHIPSFTFAFDSGVTHFASLVKRVPQSIISDLVCSMDFLFGNLWFVIADLRLSTETSCNINRLNVHNLSTYPAQRVLIEDIYKISTTFPIKVPRHEIVALPAVSDGLCLRWFNYDDRTYRRNFAYISDFCNGCVVSTSERAVGGCDR